MPSPNGPPRVVPSDRLDSWKEIASYLNRGLSTVQRWDHDEGLPVHRLHHGKGGSVFAFKHELDEWWTSRGASLESGAEHAADLSTAVPVAPGSRRVAVGVAAVLIVGAIAASARWMTSPPTPPAVLRSATQRFALPLPADYPLAPISRMPLAILKPALAVSPDGSVLVYAALHHDRVQLVSYDLDTRTVTPIVGSDDGHTPFFSPDGRRLGFIARGKLWTMEVGGGAPAPIANASSGWGATWGADGSIFFSPIEWGELMKVEPASGRTVAVASGGGRMPEALAPHLGVMATIPDEQIALIRDGRVVRPLVSGFAGRRLGSDYLLFARPGRLMAVAFDERRAEVTGSAVTLAGDLQTGPYSVAQFAATGEDTVVYAPGRDSMYGRFVRVAADGRKTRLPLPEARYREFSVTRDGRRLAATVLADTPDRYADVLVYDISAAGTEAAIGTPIPLPAGMPHVSPSFPRWDVDGRHILYALRGDTQSWLAWSRPDGSELRILWRSGEGGPQWLYPMSFSPDGRVLAAFGPSPGSRMDLYTLQIREADGSVRTNVTPAPYLATPALEAFPQFSPDGTAIAYDSDTSGRYEIYVSLHRDPGNACRVSHGTALDPTWVSGGRAIVYQSEIAIYERAVESIAECRFGPPRLLFGGFPDRPGFGHDVLPGNEWLMVESDDYDRLTTSLQVLTHVRDALRRLEAGETARP